MGQLQIRFFGGIQVSHGEGQPALRLTHKLQSLLGFLVMHRSRTFTRESLAGQFWGDVADHKARRCLNTALWRLRTALEPPGVSPGTFLPKSLPGEIGFREDSDHWLDVAEFETRARMVAQCPGEARREDADELVSALELYTGDLLDGYSDDWALCERIRLQNLYCKILEWLMAHYAQTGQLDLGIDCGQRLLNCDPLREDVHRGVIRLFLENGQRSLALRQYERCCELVSTELGVEPMGETLGLYARITGNRNPATVQSRPLFGRDEAAGLVRGALQRITRAQRLIGQANRLLQSATDREH